MKLLEPLDKMTMRKQIEYLKFKYDEMDDLFFNNFDTFSPLIANFQKELEEECKKFDAVFQEMNKFVSRVSQIRKNFHECMKSNKWRLIRLTEEKEEKDKNNQKRASATNTNSPL